MSGPTYGLVDAGVIPDDDPSHLIAVTYNSPLRLPPSWKRPGVSGALGLVVVEVDVEALR